ncbi:MAG: hypothetical protein QOC99_7 [Acidobacteriota bacterium]|jgi:hypothetical protein|nr:hypothetical protein [Acidobacteriota bacterium]MDT7777495.1 hypothetical protein [Acidobacteriota bacterium]
MNDKQRGRFERGSRVLAFITPNASDFPSNSKGGESFARLKTEIDKLAALDVTKATSMSTHRQGSVGRHDVRETLRTQIAAVCDTAEIASRDRPDVKGSFPRTPPDHSDQTLIAVARSFAEAALPLKSLFIEYDLPADFIDRLSANADALDQHITSQNRSTGTRVNTNAAIKESLRHVDDEIDRLDTIVRNKYRDDPAKLAAWESARHIEHTARTKPGGGTPPAPQTPTQT